MKHSQNDYALFVGSEINVTGKSFCSDTANAAMHVFDGQRLLRCAGNAMLDFADELITQPDAARFIQAAALMNSS